MKTPTEQLTAIADYLERQTDLAFLDYRRQTWNSIPSPSAFFDSGRFRTMEEILYARWIGVGDAYYLIRDIRDKEEDRLRMWQEFLLALLARSRHETGHITAGAETILSDQETV